MGSIDILMDNINNLASKKKLSRYIDIAAYLGISISTLKQWESKKRYPTLNALDRVGDKLNVPTYLLLQKESDLTVTCRISKNNSREIFINNLEEIFTNKGRFSWRAKTSLFFGFVSEDMLKSYFRKTNYRVPPLKILDEMAEALGVPTYQLIKGE